MKKKILIALSAILCALLLTGCFCKHEWMDANCTTPKTCSLCEKTEGEALGHTWKDATCDAPKTCSACGETEGEALGHTWQDATCETPKTCSTCHATEGEIPGHSWTEWVVGEDTQSHRCETCGIEEVTDITPDNIVASLLEGTWNSLWGDISGQTADAEGMYSFEFSADGDCLAKLDYDIDCIWEYEDYIYDEETGEEGYFVIVTADDGSQVQLLLHPMPTDEDPDYVLMAAYFSETVYIVFEKA